MEKQCERLCKKRGRYICGASSAPSQCRSKFDIPEAGELLTEDRLRDRERRMQEIREALKREKNGLTLVLGAGISIPLEMPSWVGLISKMSGYALRYRDYRDYYANKGNRKRTVDEQEQANRLQTALINGKLHILEGINVLEAAQYIWDGLASDGKDMQATEEQMKGIISLIMDSSVEPEKFLAEKSCYLAQYYIRHPEKISAGCDAFKKRIDAVRTKVFQGGSKEPDWGKVQREELESVRSDIPDKLHRRLDQFTDAEKAETLRDIAQENTFCAVVYLLYARCGFRRVVTYNYDTLVEEYLTSVFGVPPDGITSHTESWANRSGGNGISIFHVHGRIPRSVPGKPGCHEEESSRLILSEDSYYETERYGAYNWQNSVQSYYLNRDHCVFIGFSADDYNFRRILRQMEDRSEDRPEHYLLLTIDPIIHNLYESVCCYQLSRKDAKAAPADIWSDMRFLLDQILVMREQYWKRYGLYPIWVTIAELPRFLLALSNT